MRLNKPIVLANWFAIKTSDKADLMKAHARNAIDSFSRGWSVPPCKSSKNQSAYISADDLVAVQEDARAIGASVSDL